MHILPLITDSATLASLCARLSQADFVCVDTEFMRESTYWPELCLIQVSDGNEAAAVDPLAPGLDMQPLLDLMVANEEVLKVFHAGGQDIEIVYNLTGKTPHPLFDTQVAAMALGQGEQIGYSNLVDSWLGLQIDKGARFTDWARRPLDARQIDYAIGDVTHLARIFPKMLERLRKTGRGGWLDQEMERLADPANYANDPDLAWKRVRVPSRKPEVMGRLKAIARWRELEARGKDLPRGRIAKDETVADIASHPPKRPGGPRQGARAVAGMGRQRNRCAADDRDRGRAADDGGRTATARRPQARSGQGRRAGRGPAEAAAEDPRQGDRRRIPPAGAVGGAGDAGVGRARRAADAAGLALRPVRAGRGWTWSKGGWRSPSRAAS